MIKRKSFTAPTSGRIHLALYSSVTESNARKYAQEYTYDILTSITRDQYPNALSVETETIITDWYDMDTVSSKALLYDGGERIDVEYQVLYTGIYDDIGDSINITTNELGLSAGENYTVVQNNLNLNTGVCTQRGRT